MPGTRNQVNTDQFLEELQHPLRDVILLLRKIIKSAEPALEENIKWNAPNYSYGGKDRLTMKLFPGKSIHLVFHLGAKPGEKGEKIEVDDPAGLLDWKASDRAITGFSSVPELSDKKVNLTKLIRSWLKTTT